MLKDTNLELFVAAALLAFCAIWCFCSATLVPAIILTVMVVALVAAAFVKNPENK